TSTSRSARRAPPSSRRCGRPCARSATARRSATPSWPAGSGRRPPPAPWAWPTGATRSRSSSRATGSSGPTGPSPATAGVWSASGGSWSWSAPTPGPPCSDRGRAARDAGPAQAGRYPERVTPSRPAPEHAPAASPATDAAPPPVAAPGDGDLPEQMRVRLAKREALLAPGEAPYPVHVPRPLSLADVRENWGHLQAGEETQDVVGVAGRVVFVRNTGKLCFATLQAGDGTRLQVMLSLAEVGAEALERWKDLVDLGDHVFVRGRVVSSRRGELSVMASEWRMASKALRPLPVLHKELSEEQRVRRRYVDLIVREEARRMVHERAAVVRAIRRVLEDEAYTEIETPVLQTVHGGATARPFHTHLNAFDLPMTLRIALELYLKRAVVGGIERVYEIGRVFRNEGIDSSHSPEFTMLELYEAYGDQYTMADLTRRIVLAAAD